MEIREKLRILGDFSSAPSDLDGRGALGPCGLPVASKKKPLGIHLAKMPGGRVMRLARVMQTNACSLSCNYCATRCGRPIKRTTFRPEELATTFFTMYRRRQAEGLFLTSGIPGKAIRVMDLMLKTAEILRMKLQYKGYLHLKILPGCELNQIERASQLANRVSLNLEAPTPEKLRAIAPEKDFQENYHRLAFAGQYRLKTLQENGRTQAAPAGITTQFVVGATTDTDQEILKVVSQLYQERILHHAHFSPFQPVAQTPLEEHRPAPELRGHRLYQADHLMKEYGFLFEEFVFGAEGDLPLLWDPKMAWALRHPERFPIEVITASREDLLRVPGIGPKTATNILATRSQAVFRDLRDLSKAGVITKRASGFVTLKGKLLTRPDLLMPRHRIFEQQLELWPSVPPRHFPLLTSVSPGSFR